ncbi:hypothetical protein [Polymorphospora sp. NPDC050346]|uniref:hypothetical protein n=1 Tax=Polymorphospora sp. NPDC050346 TaxID=3155780 RepID=UPI0033F0FDF6
MDTLIMLGGRFSLLLCAVVVAFLAHRLHKKASGKRAKAKQTAAVLIMFCAGLLLAGTFVGGWMSSNFGQAGGYLAGGLVLFTVGAVLIDWVADGKPDKVALWATLLVPLALFIGAGQVMSLLELMGQQGADLGEHVSTQMGR